ncbi:MAG: VCBS repeat-containing protein, partial [Gemmataceae bacterium]|nr:VCBS repeat-containing protein [Gemmataceae bacterium]
SGFQGGVRTAVGDVTGDGIPDIITAPGFGGGPHIKVFDGATGAVVAEFFAYAASFTGGVYVAVGDVNGDGVGEIITGAGETGGPHVKIFTATGGLVREFFAYAASFTGGVRVAAGDINGDGFDDIITGAGPGGGPHVKVFSGQAGQGVLKEFFAYAASFTGGVFVAAGDVDGDMLADIVTGGGGNAQVQAFRGTDLTLLYASYAYGSTFTGGTRVGVLDVNGDCKAEILTTPGAGLASFTRIIDVARGADVENFRPFDPTYLGGAYVSGGHG